MLFVAVIVMLPPCPLLLVPLAAATVIVVPVSFWIFNTALRHARRAGSLNQY